MFKSFCKNLLLHCDHRQDVPDDELVADLFCEALKDSGPCSPPPWVLSGRVDVPGDAAGPSYRALGIHLSGQLMSEGRTKELLLLTGNGLNRFIFICLLFEMSAADIVGFSGSTLEETRRLAAGYQNIVPVRSSGGHLVLLDLAAPFLFRGRKQYYGSDANVTHTHTH